MNIKQEFEMPIDRIDTKNRKKKVCSICKKPKGIGFFDNFFQRTDWRLSEEDSSPVVCMNCENDTHNQKIVLNLKKTPK